MTIIIKSIKVDNFYLTLSQEDNTYKVRLSHRCGGEDLYRTDKESTFVDLKKANNRYNALKKAIN